MMCHSFHILWTLWATWHLAVGQIWPVGRSLCTTAEGYLFFTQGNHRTEQSELHPPTVQESNCQTLEYALSFHPPFVPL